VRKCLHGKVREKKNDFFEALKNNLMIKCVGSSTNGR
jgi:hypothetical protein